MVNSATLATRELFFAAREYFKVTVDDSAGIADAKENIELVLDKWMHYQPGCDYSTNYCDTPWAPLAKSSETYPMLSCSAQGWSNSPGQTGAYLRVFMMVLWFMRTSQLQAVKGFLKR